MSILGKFKSSALELKNIRCIVLTGILIALDIVLKMFSIKITADLKITFAYLALAAIGMLFGPTVGFLSGIITDVIGFMLSPDGGFSPLFTFIEAVGAMIYGLFLYDMKPTDLFSGKNKEAGKSRLMKDILVSVCVGIAAGAVIGIIFWAVWVNFSVLTEAEGMTGKIAKVFADSVIVYVAAIIGFLYGAIFTFIIRSRCGNGSEFRNSLRIILCKVCIVVLCNLIMTPAAMILSGYTTLDSTIAGYPLRLIKNAVQCPVDCVIMLIILPPVLLAYKRHFSRIGVKKTAA